MMIKRKIYNFYQADYLIQNGATVIGCGKDTKTNFILFQFDEVFDKYMEEWRIRKR